MNWGVALRLRLRDSSSTIWPTAYQRAALRRYEQVSQFFRYKIFMSSDLPRDHLLLYYPPFCEGFCMMGLKMEEPGLGWRRVNELRARRGVINKLSGDLAG